MRVLSQKNRAFQGMDWWIVLCVIALSMIGILAITAATANPFTGEEATLQEKLSRLDLSLPKRQLLWIAAGMIALFAISFVNSHALKDISKYILLGNILLLLLIFILAETIRGATSWYTFGSIGFQPSEICKISLILYLAMVFSDRANSQKIESLQELVLPLGATAVVFLLVVLQHDFGTATVYLMICLGMLFVARVGWKIAAMMFGGVAVAAPLTWIFLLNDTQKNRILAMINPEYDLQNSGWTVRYSKIAIGSGGFLGKGIFSDGVLTQLDWVPDRETDFIFAVICEVFGFLGGIIVILLYIFLIYRIITIGIKADTRFGTYICVGVASMLMFHIFENIGMTMGVMPVTGIPLPFISYGGSSMLTNMMAVGLVLGVRRNTRSQY